MTLRRDYEALPQNVFRAPLGQKDAGVFAFFSVSCYEATKLFQQGKNFEYTITMNYQVFEKSPVRSKTSEFFIRVLFGII